MKIFCIIAVLFIAWIVNTSLVMAQDNNGKAVVMKRYMVERSFPERSDIPLNEEGCLIIQGVVFNNAEEHVVWIHSYVSTDKKKTYCKYEAPSPEAIRQAADKDRITVDKIIELSVLDPYFYK
jgi:hypothetical protein